LRLVSSSAQREFSQADLQQAITHTILGKMQLIFILTVLVSIKRGYAIPQSKGSGGGGAELIGSLLKGMGGSVPLGPAPGGCSKYEILVGTQSSAILQILTIGLQLTA
jgi:hypothetical protein